MLCPSAPADSSGGLDLSVTVELVSDKLRRDGERTTTSIHGIPFCLQRVQGFMSWHLSLAAAHDLHALPARGLGSWKDFLFFADGASWWLTCRLRASLPTTSGKKARGGSGEFELTVLRKLFRMWNTQRVLVRNLVNISVIASIVAESLERSGPYGYEHGVRGGRF